MIARRGSRTPSGSNSPLSSPRRSANLASELQARLSKRPVQTSHNSTAARRRYPEKNGRATGGRARSASSPFSRGIVHFTQGHRSAILGHPIVREIGISSLRGASWRWTG